MHDKNLYQATSIYANLFQPNFLKLVSLIKSHTGVPNTRNSEQKIQDRCMDFINTSARTWELDGLLVTRNNVRRKSEVFQHLWDSEIQAARVSYDAAQSIERAFPRDNSGNAASSVDLDSMTGATKARQESSLRKVLIYLSICEDENTLMLVNREVLQACNSSKNLRYWLRLNDHAWSNQIFWRILRETLLRSTAVLLVWRVMKKILPRKA
jgi:hypothetical protein